MTLEHFSIARGDVVASVTFFLSRHTSVYQEVWAENCSWMSYAGLGLHKEFLNCEVCGSFWNTAKQTCTLHAVWGGKCFRGALNVSSSPWGKHLAFQMTKEELHFLKTYKNEVSGQISRSSGSLLRGHVLERNGVVIHPSHGFFMTDASEDDSHPFHFTIPCPRVR